MSDYIYNLDDLQKSGEVKCPYCNKIISYAYEIRGKQSCQCSRCKKYVLIDYDKMTAFKVRARKYVS